MATISEKRESTPREMGAPRRITVLASGMAIAARRGTSEASGRGGGGAAKWGRSGWAWVWGVEGGRGH